jgi:hypothetical protein
MTICYREGSRALVFGVLLIPLAFTVEVVAQERSLDSDGLHSDKLLIRRHLAPTGAVVPKLGQPQIGPATGLNRQIQRRDDQITRSICSNCGPQ